NRLRLTSARPRTSRKPAHITNARSARPSARGDRLEPAPAVSRGARPACPGPTGPAGSAADAGLDPAASPLRVERAADGGVLYGQHRRDLSPGTAPITVQRVGAI